MGGEKGVKNGKSRLEEGGIARKGRGAGVR